MIPLPVPPDQRTLRVLNCRSCGHETGIPGAAYCDPCRPHRTTDALLTAVDRARLTAPTTETDTHG